MLAADPLRRKDVAGVSRRLTAGLNSPPLTLAKMETLTAREKPNAKLMYRSWVRLISPGWMSSPAWEVSELATWAADSAISRNKNVPTASPEISTAWSRRCLTKLLGAMVRVGFEDVVA